MCAYVQSKSISYADGQHNENLRYNPKSDSYTPLTRVTPRIVPEVFQREQYTSTCLLVEDIRRWRGECRRGSECTL